MLCSYKKLSFGMRSRDVTVVFPLKPLLKCLDLRISLLPFSSLCKCKPLPGHWENHHWKSQSCYGRQRHWDHWFDLKVFAFYERITVRYDRLFLRFYSWYMSLKFTSFSYRKTRLWGQTPGFSTINTGFWLPKWVSPIGKMTQPRLNCIYQE